MDPLQLSVSNGRKLEIQKIPLEMDKESPPEGMEAEQIRKKMTRVFGTQPKARAGWPKRLVLLRATPWADFAIIGVQL